jgi:hypothetical protein
LNRNIIIHNDSFMNIVVVNDVYTCVC